MIKIAMSKLAVFFVLFLAVNAHADPKAGSYVTNQGGLNASGTIGGGASQSKVPCITGMSISKLVAACTNKKSLDQCNISATKKGVCMLLQGNACECR